MSFKKMMFIITIITVGIFTLTLSTSYAWFTYSGGATDWDSLTSDVDLNVIYAQSKIIKATTGLPINDAEKERYADSNVFTVSSPQELYNHQIILTISLINIRIDEELKTKDFKYELLQDNIVIESGTGKDFNEKIKILKDNISIDPTKTYTYNLRIWLSETSANQNDLMNKSFQAQIQVDSIAKK